MISGLTWRFAWLARWRSAYVKVSGIGVPSRLKASRCVLVGSVSIGRVTWVAANRTWLRVRVARWSQQVAEAAVGLPGRVALGGGLGLRGRGAAGRGDGVARGGRVLVGEGQRRPGPAQVPGQVAGEHADQHVGPDAFLEPVPDGPQVQVIGFDVPEVPLDVFEVLVGGDHGGGVQFVSGDGGAQHVEAVQGGLGVDLVLLAGNSQAVIGDGDGEVLAGLVGADDLAGLDPDLPAPASRPARTRVMRGASSFSVAASSSSRVRARSAASAGLRQAMSRSPGKSGLVISARSCSSNKLSCSGPSSAMSLLIAGARSAVIHP